MCIRDREIGVQSTNEITIREIHRTMKLELLKDIVRKIQNGENIHEHLDLIAGLPYEDYATFAKSFDEIYALKPNQLHLSLIHINVYKRQVRRYMAVRWTYLQIQVGNQWTTE